MKFIVSIILAFFCSFYLYAQENEGMEDIVYLKDGSIFRGVIESNEDGMVSFKSWKGLAYNFAATDVKKIVQKRKRIPATYNFKEKGIFNSTNISLMGSKQTFGEVILRPSAENVTGYQFNRYIGTGLGLGIDLYEPDVGRVVVPIYLQARGYFLEKKISPMYKVDIGYGITTKSENFESSRGGLMLHPSLGFRFGGRNTANFTLDFGFKLQKAKYRYDWWWENTEQQVTYRSYTLRMGILF